MTTPQLSERESKALAIATHTQLVRKPNNTWIVPSQSGPKTYTVNPDPQSPFCDCPDFEFRRARCKHVLAVEIILKREIMLTRAIETLSRARLYLSQSNFGLAKIDVQSARSILAELSTEAPPYQVNAFDQIIGRLDLALGNLPPSPLSRWMMWILHGNC